MSCCVCVLPNFYELLQVPVQSGSKCTDVGFNINPDLQVCAGGERGKSACRGDSGGGLFINDEDGGPWYLFGIVSFGGFDCEAEIPEAYTRYDYYILILLSIFLYSFQGF